MGPSVPSPWISFPLQGLVLKLWLLFYSLGHVTLSVASKRCEKVQPGDPDRICPWQRCQDGALENRGSLADNWLPLKERGEFLLTTVSCWHHQGMESDQSLNLSVYPGRLGRDKSHPGRVGEGSRGLWRSCSVV